MPYCAPSTPSSLEATPPDGSASNHRARRRSCALAHGRGEHAGGRGCRPRFPSLLRPNSALEMTADSQAFSGQPSHARAGQTPRSVAVARPSHPPLQAFIRGSRRKARQSRPTTGRRVQPWAESHWLWGRGCSLVVDRRGKPPGLLGLAHCWVAIPQVGNECSGEHRRSPPGPHAVGQTGQCRASCPISKPPGSSQYDRRHVPRHPSRAGSVRGWSERGTQRQLRSYGLPLCTRADMPSRPEQVRC